MKKAQSTYALSVILLFSFEAIAQKIKRTQLKEPVAAETTIAFPAAPITARNAKTLSGFVQPAMVLYTNDVRYVTRDGVDLHLQVLLPDNDSPKKLPCIIYVQGSAWMKQDVYFGLQRLMKFAERGFAIFSVEYRGTNAQPPTIFPGQVLDAKTAIRFVRANADKYNIDPNNIFIWGDSSGGHTALMTGITEDVASLETSDYPGVSTHVNAVVDYYGPTDIAIMNTVPSIMDHTKPESPEGMLIGSKDVIDNQDLAEKTNPLNYLTNAKKIPPILIMHGDRDRLVPLLCSDMLANKLQELGKVYEYYVLKDADHASYEFWTDKSYDIVEAFLKKNMK